MAFVVKDELGRREFLGAAGAAMLTVAGTNGELSADADNKTPIVDTHLHCFAGKDDPRFPYHPRGPYRPEKAATPEHLLKCMDEADVDFAVVVHPEPYQDDHRYLEHCLNVGKRRLKGTCLFFADRPGSVAKMPALVKKFPGRIVAARIHAFRPKRIPRFDTRELKELWKTASDLGLAIQLHFQPRYAPGFEPLIKEFSKTKVVIDHLGRPLQGTPKEHKVVVRWSRFPNTVMKVSSLQGKPNQKIASVIQTLTKAFGADRLIYGGGFNADATGKSYRAYREQARSYLAHLSSSDQAKVLGGTAARLFGFVKS